MDQAMLKMAQPGARVRRLEDHAVALYDCDAWSDAKSRRLRALFPTVEVEYQYAPDSLSQFIIVARAPPPPRAHWIAAFALLLAAVACLSWRLHARA
jgi:transposase